MCDQGIQDNLCETSCQLVSQTHLNIHVVFRDIKISVFLSARLTVPLTLQGVLAWSMLSIS